MADRRRRQSGGVPSGLESSEDAFARFDHAAAESLRELPPAAVADAPAQPAAPADAGGVPAALRDEGVAAGGEDLDGDGIPDGAQVERIIKRMDDLGREVVTRAKFVKKKRSKFDRLDNFRRARGSRDTGFNRNVDRRERDFTAQENAINAQRAGVRQELLGIINNLGQNALPEAIRQEGETGRTRLTERGSTDRTRLQEEGETGRTRLTERGSTLRERLKQLGAISTEGQRQTGETDRTRMTERGSTARTKIEQRGESGRERERTRGSVLTERERQRGESSRQTEKLGQKPTFETMPTGEIVAHLPGQGMMQLKPNPKDPSVLNDDQGNPVAVIGPDGQPTMIPADKRRRILPGSAGGTQSEAVERALGNI